MNIVLTYNEKRSLDERDAEFDTREAIATVAQALGALGHTAVPIDVTGSIPALVQRLAQAAPDLVLNFAEGERGAFREAFYPALFDQLGLATVGSAPSTLALCLDKALAKRVVAASGVRVPPGGIATCVEDVGELRYPLIVKPNCEGSSKGITAASIVRAPDELPAVLAAACASHPHGVLVEELVPGIDVSVGWIAALGLLPSIHYAYAGEVYDFALKHVTPERVSIITPAVLSPRTAADLATAARRAFTALGVAGYGRADFRITPEGEVIFLEMNPLPSLTLVAGHDELYAAAAVLGKSPADVLAAILVAAPSPRPS